MSGWANKAVRRLAAEMREFRRWKALRAADDVRVYYGMDRLPSRAEPISGGGFSRGHYLEPVEPVGPSIPVEPVEPVPP